MNQCIKKPFERVATGITMPFQKVRAETDTF
jgi:hypothetical protein